VHYIIWDKSDHYIVLMNTYHKQTIDRVGNKNMAKFKALWVKNKHFEDGV